MTNTHDSVVDEVIEKAWLETVEHMDSGIRYYFDGQKDGFKAGFEAAMKWRDEQNKNERVEATICNTCGLGNSISRTQCETCGETL